MTEFLIYQGKAAIALAVFYMFYRLLLSKETFHRFNRIVLLGTAALSFILPLCVITLKKVVVIPAAPVSSETLVGEVAETVAMVPEAVRSYMAGRALLVIRSRCTGGACTCRLFDHRNQKNDQQRKQADS